VKMRMQLSVVIVLVLASAASAAPPKTKFVYRNWLRNDSIQIVPPQEGKNGRIWVAIDAVEDANFCPEDAAFVCFTSSYYALAIPKNFDPSKKSWEHEGVTYDVVRTGVSVSIFGRTMSDLSLIKAPSSATPGMRSTGEDGYFFYSREYGVVGFGFWKKDDNGERTYWLDGEKGFGAMPEPR
jgi:hypothetical protein